MSDSPTAAVFQRLDLLDADGAAALFAPDGKLTMIYGRTAAGAEQVRTMLTEFCGHLRATGHTLTAEWNPEPGVWIAELTATYELQNFERLGPYARAAILREGPAGISELNIYGAHEQPLGTTGGYQEVFASGRWLPTL